MAVTSHHAPGFYPLTQWQLIWDLRQGSTIGKNAFGQLYEIYYTPIFRYIRKLNWSYDDAEELTNDFFYKCLTNALFENSHPRKGKLRSLICTAVNRHVADEAKRRCAQKRGGNLPPEDLAAIADHLMSHCEVFDSPDDAFARECARSILEGVWKELRDSFDRKDELYLFEALSPYIAGPAPPCEKTQKETAIAIEMQPTAFSNRLVTLRKQYRAMMTCRVALTAESPDDIEGELADIQRLFSK